MPEQASPPAITPNDPPAASAEAARMAAVRRYDILDTPPDGAYDRVASLAARLFEVPVATVTIVDEDRIWFKATHGLEGVTEIGRDPGLCASAVLTDDTTVIPDTLLDPLACSNPLVAGPMGVRFYAAAPIITADGYRLGTVNILDTRPRELSEADAATLADLAAVVRDQLELRLSALHVLRAEQERRRVEEDKRQAEEEARQRAEQDKAAIATFASTLQRTLVPPALPAVPGLELACHYKTASPQEVGGDFYDAFPVGGGRWAFFLGDVCGKGAEAASVTSLTRYTLRAAALVDPDPMAALQALNTALLLDAAVGTRFCTAVFGLLDPTQGGGFTLTLATGGHPPAYHLSPTKGGGVKVEAARAKGGMLVGAFAEATFASHTLHLAPGEGLLLYTDGLTEARTADGHMLADAGLTDFLAQRPAPVSAGTLIKDTVALLDTLPDTERDDVALLALSVPTAATAPVGITTTAHSAAAPTTPADTSVGQENRRP
ncbi:PP2C family protein-serine/threonine phosphatase [Streptomyces venezuelae]|uniref:PP2C family protein-serine/threonine phosphatase n=1 Tax=Streptomyces venezuelae TaxID=54571 RepID=UPI0037B3D704